MWSPEEKLSQKQHAENSNQARLYFAKVYEAEYGEYYNLPDDLKKSILPIEHLDRVNDYRHQPEFAHLWEGFQPGDPRPVEFDYSKIFKFTWKEWREYFDETIEMYKHLYE